MNDNDDIAILAATTSQGLRQLLRPPGTERTDLGGITPSKLVDWRQFAGNNPQVNYNQPSGALPYTQLPPDNVQVSVPRMLQVPVGVDPQGNTILGNPDQLPAYSPTPNLTPPGPLQTTGFQLPNYGNNNLPGPNAATTETDSKLDELTKEIKSLKKAINKLIRLQEAAKSDTSNNITKPSTEEDIETTTKS